MNPYKQGAKDWIRLNGFVDAAIGAGWRAAIMVGLIMIQVIPFTQVGRYWSDWQIASFYIVEFVIVYSFFRSIQLYRYYLWVKSNDTEYVREYLAKARAKYEADPDNDGWVGCDRILDKWDREADQDEEISDEDSRVTYLNNGNGAKLRR